MRRRRKENGSPENPAQTKSGRGEWGAGKILLIFLFLALLWAMGKSVLYLPNVVLSKL
jgi:hypothetical protein